MFIHWKIRSPWGKICKGKMKKKLGKKMKRGTISGKLKLKG
jgi:hypothetical protein